MRVIARQSSVVAVAVLTGWLAMMHPVAGDERDCVPHSLETAQIKQHLRRWPGLAPFHRWRLLKVVPGNCVVDGAIDALLVMAPPASWSRLDVAYRVRVKLRLTADAGEPVGAAPQHFKDLAAGVRHLLPQAERHEDVRRFVERYPPLQADFAWVGNELRVIYQTDTDTAGQAAAPRLVFCQKHDGICAYRIPCMDGLPARPELLRMVESLSRHHPGCRPTRVQAEWKENSSLPRTGPPDGGDGDNPAGRWEIDFVLEGAGCPVAFGGVVTADRAVLDLRASKTVYGGE